MARFFHLREGLEGVKETIQAGIATDEKALAKIEAVSAEYPRGGQAFENVGRALMGKEAVSEAKGPGKLAKQLRHLTGRNAPACSPCRTAWKKPSPG